MGQACCDAGGIRAGGWSDGSEVVLVQYNMMMNSLSCGAIPWLMMVPESLKSRCRNWDEVYKTVFKEYKQHWHKNKAAGNFVQFRRLWGEDLADAEILSQPGFTELKARWIAPQQMRYSEPVPGDILNEVACKSLLGHFLDLVQDKAADDPGAEAHKLLAREIFDHVRAASRNIFDWQYRGIEIFKLITNSAAADDEKVLKRFFEPCGLVQGQQPDIIVLCEYDVMDNKSKNNPDLEYFPGEPPMSFPAAMMKAGYHVVFCDSPPENWGIAIFAKASVFAVATGSSASVRSDPSPQLVKINCTDLGTAPNKIDEEYRAKSLDLKETFHKPGDPADKLSEMSVLDRRTLGIVALEFLPPHPRAGQKVVVAGTHLMAKNRDNSATVQFPGEIRAQQIERIAKEVGNFVQAGDAVIFCGDFNVNMCKGEEEYIFKGVIPHSSASAGGACSIPPLTFSTGYESGVFNWPLSDGRKIRLKDAYVGENRVETTADGRKVGTSHNTDRLETIDFIFYDEANITLVAASPLVVPFPESMPDMDNPSDHLPTVARLRVKPLSK